MITASKWLWNGLNNYTYRAFEKKKVHFDPNDLNQDISNKHIIVTGGSGGLGFQTSLELAKLGGNVHIICRNKEKGEKALNEIKEISKSDKVFLHQCDVSLVCDIRSFVDSWKSNGNHRVDVLIHNAGVMNQTRFETNEGIENTFATNLLAPFLLTKLLVCDNVGSADSGSGSGNSEQQQQKQRVIFVSSGGMLTQKMSKDFEFNRFKNGEKKWDGMVAYAQTKRALIYLTELFSEKYENINFYSTHPGWCETDGLTKGMPIFAKLTRSQLRTPQQGVDTTVWLSVSPTIEDHSKYSGLFFEDRQPVDKFISGSNCESSQDDINLLWSHLNEYCNK